MTSEDHPELEQTHALADGELSGAALESAQDHLATCERCQAELADIMQLAAMPLPSIRAGVTPLAWYRKRSTQLAGVVVAAAAATVLYLGTRNHGITPPPPTKIALANTRSMEARLSWQGAADYREYSVQRGATSTKEPVSLSAMADLEKSGDLHGVGALALLGGDLEQAKKYLALAGESPEVLADHAALELQLGEPEKALMFADSALTKAPDTTVATWNRALALRDLGLDHDAADAFRVVAKRNEPGWSVEAGKRADELEQSLLDAIRLETRVFAAATPFPATGEGLSLDDARRMPGVARVELYDAMFSAPDAARIAKLKPFADALGAGDALARAKPDPVVAKAYLSLLDGNANRDHVLATLRTAHANDALVLAFVKLGDDNGIVLDKDIAEMSKLAAASPDPWIQILGLEQQAARAFWSRDLAGAERPLLAARTKCEAGAPNHRCMKISFLLGRTYLLWERLPEARAALEDAWKRARMLSAEYDQGQILQQLANLSVLADDTVGGGLALVRAYAAEIAARAALDQKEHRNDSACDLARWGNERVASVLVIQLRVDEAAKMLAAVTCPPIDNPVALVAGLFIRSEVVHLAGTPAQVDALRKDIAAARNTANLAIGERALLDLADGRAIINSDPKQGEALLHQAITEAGRDPNNDNVSRAIGASYATLAITAAKRGDGDTAFAVLGEELGVAPRKTCVLGLAVDDRDVVTVARGTDGKNVVDAYERTTTDLVPDKVIPGRVVTALQGCPDVDVIARPPYHGVSRLLPDEMAWRYLTRRAHPTGEPKGESLVIADVQPPPSLKLPHLATWSRAGTVITGAAATPSHVLAAIGSARDVIIHAHGLADHGDASYLALSPDLDGRYALTAGEVEHAHFASNPIVILAACEAARAAPVFHARWSLPAAFVIAGAKAVIAPTTAVPDNDAAEFFDELRTNVAAGQSAAVVLRDLRKKWLTRVTGNWVHDVVVFE
jgi:tetratricopeptide (TPR) repeat protein